MKRSAAKLDLKQSVQDPLCAAVLRDTHLDQRHCHTVPHTAIHREQHRLEGGCACMHCCSKKQLTFRPICQLCLRVSPF